MLVVLSLACLWHLCFRFGPYVHDSYEPKSLLKSFWAYRPLRKEYLCNFEDLNKSQQRETREPEIDVKDIEKKSDSCLVKEELSAISEEDPSSEDSTIRQLRKSSSQFTNVLTSDQTTNVKASQRSVQKEFIDGKVIEEPPCSIFNSEVVCQEDNVSFSQARKSQEVFALPDIKDRNDNLFRSNSNLLMHKTV